MHGDRVRVRAARDASNRWLGAVEAVVERGVKAFLGTVERTRADCVGHRGGSALALRCLGCTERPARRARTGTG